MDSMPRFIFLKPHLVLDETSKEKNHILFRQSTSSSQTKEQSSISNDDGVEFQKSRSENNALSSRMGTARKPLSLDSAVIDLLNQLNERQHHHMKSNNGKVCPALFSFSISANRLNIDGS